jgi:hypothetical protein
MKAAQGLLRAAVLWRGYLVYEAQLVAQRPLAALERIVVKLNREACTTILVYPELVGFTSKPFGKSGVCRR